MLAGRLKYRIQLFKPDRSINRFGEETLMYLPVKTIHAERVKHTGYRSEEVKEHFADYRAEFNIRAAHEVKEGWRVQLLGENLYEITNILPNIDRGFNTLVCARVNE